eukprot:424110-Lingulodinium_polyedra.AAC.1
MRVASPTLNLAAAQKMANPARHLSHKSSALESTFPSAYSCATSKGAAFLLNLFLANELATAPRIRA